MRNELMIESSGIDMDQLPEKDDYLAYLFKLKLLLFRKYDILVEVCYDFTSDDLGFYGCLISNAKDVNNLKWSPSDTIFLKTADYLEALEIGLLEAIRILKEKGKL